MAASPDARSAVLEWLGLKSVRIERREPRAPPPRPARSAPARLGTPVTLAQARAARPFRRCAGRAGWGARRRLRSASSVALVYGEREGYVARARTGAALLVQEFPARVGQFIEKPSAWARGPSGCASTATRRTSSPARTGSPTSGGGTRRFEEQRLAGNTLLVERADGLLLRVEGDITRDRAVAVARSIPVTRRGVNGGVKTGRGGFWRVAERPAARNRSPGVPAVRPPSASGDARERPWHFAARPGAADVRNARPAASAGPVLSSVGVTAGGGLEDAHRPHRRR